MANCQGNPSMVNIDYKKLDLEDVNDFNTIVGLVEGNFSEPYSLYVYRYFLSGWPDLCITVSMISQV